jgi:prepilin-type processing-associated H-X9-DG protein
VRKQDVAILILCVAFLVSNLGAVGDSGRRRAREFVCLTNVRQLAQGWLLFAQEHDGELVGGHTMDNPMQWVGWPAPVGATAEQKQDSLRKGRLFPYVGNVHIYHCPAAEPQGNQNPFDPRSFSIAGGANGETWNEYEKATRYAELENPSRRYVFVEAAATRGALLGSWQMNPRSKVWVDPVAMWHDRKSTLGFADGHAQTHAWHDPSFINWNLVAMYEPAQFSFGMTPPAGEREDIEYMAKGFPCKALR